MASPEGNLPPLSPRVQEFISSAQQERKIQFEFGKLIDNLHREGLGRSIVVQSKDKTEVKGVILPIDVDNTRHAVLLKNETVLIIEAETQESEGRYVGRTRPQEIPLSFSFRPFVEVDEIEKRIRGGSTLCSKLVMTNSEERIAEVVPLVHRAINMAREFKEAKEKVEAMESTDIFREENFRFLYRRKKA